jgi:glycosyltransferase involved in cell wall biosynthesis
MRIGVFAVMAGRRAAGPETYEVSLVRALAEHDRSNEYEVFCLNHAARSAFAIEQDNVRFHVLWPAIRWVSVPVTLPITLMASRVDLLHATFIPPPLSPIGYVFTMHDLTMFHNPEFYSPLIRWRLNRSIGQGLSRSRVILCVSECVRQIGIRDFGLDPKRLTVVHHGVDPNFYPRSTEWCRRLLAAEYRIDRPYALFVGQIKARKNIIRILQAFERVRAAGDSELSLILAGRRGRTSDGIDETISRLRLADHVIELGHVRQEHLPELYSAAEMLVFPSLFEGFGFPVIEAMACGTPVVTSNVSALPEVAGRAALLVDPNSVEEIAGAMSRLRGDLDLQSVLRARGLERAKEFTWKRAAEQTCLAYKQALRN